MNKGMDHLFNKSYMLQIAAASPRFNGVLENFLPSPEQGLVLQTKLRELLTKNIISRVPCGEEDTGFYSRYFLVQKNQVG